MYPIGTGDDGGVYHVLAGAVSPLLWHVAALRWPRDPLICQTPRDGILFYSMNWLRLIANTVVLLLSLWGIFAAVTVVFDVNVYFPFRVTAENSIPEHRWQTARVSIFLTFAYYGFVHLLNGSKEVYPIHFLKVFLFFLTVSGAVICIKAAVPPLEFLVVAFFGGCFLLLHIASRARFRKYFSKR